MVQAARGELLKAIKKEFLTDGMEEGLLSHVVFLLSNIFFSAAFAVYSRLWLAGVRSSEWGIRTTQG